MSAPLLFPCPRCGADSEQPCRQRNHDPYGWSPWAACAPHGERVGYALGYRDAVSDAMGATP
jgi:hypothetical protein